MKKVLIGAVAAISLLSACGGGAEPSRSQTIEVSKPPEKDAVEAAPTNIEDALLKLDDMPAGWSEQEAGKTTYDTSICGEPVPQEAIPVDSAASEFAADPTNGPIIGHRIFRFKPGDASKRMAILLDGSESCGKFKSKGNPASVQGLAFESVGDESTATRLVAENDIGLTGIMDQVRWRRGDLGVSLTYISSSPDIFSLEEWVRKADNKLKALYEEETS